MELGYATNKPSSKEKEIIPIEDLTDQVFSLEQFVAEVIDYSSKYNIESIVAYSPENVVGPTAQYPSYGDSPYTYSLPTYGTWWHESEAAKQEYMVQEIDPLGAEDFLTVRFGDSVVPRDVCIYETFNPGAVVRIWGRNSKSKWCLLWEGLPQLCLEVPRKFQPPIKKLNYLINEIRLEFNQSPLKYHTAIDAVLLGGFASTKYFLQQQILEADLLSSVIADTSDMTINEEVLDGLDYFSNLPHEVILHIFQNLDLRSLTRCAQVNRAWSQATLDATLYKNLSLKRYWHKINADNFNYFLNRCRGVKKLDMSWCGSSDSSFSEIFILFLQQCCPSLTHLALNHCKFVNHVVLAQIWLCKELSELHLRNASPFSSNLDCLSTLDKLVTLDVSSTYINDNCLKSILRSNPHLKHLNIDFCEKLHGLDDIVAIMAKYNKNITTFSSFKTKILTPFGASHFANCVNLRELDLGWCIMEHPGDCLEKIALGCPDLKRLVLCSWRGINDSLLSPLIRSAKNLSQLSLQGIRMITEAICEQALLNLTKLRFLDLNYCDSISDEKVTIWRRQYRHVTIQRFA